MKFIKLSVDNYPIKFYNKTLKSSNILKLNGIGLKNKNEEEIKNVLNCFNLNCVTYLIDNYDIIYLEFYCKKDSLFLFNFFKNKPYNNIPILKNYKINAEYVNIKYQVYDKDTNVYTKYLSNFFKKYENIIMYQNIIDKIISDEIIESFNNQKWIKYTKNHELNICYYFCRKNPNKIYKSYCIKELSSFFSLNFMNILKKIFKDKEPNQVSIINCHVNKSIDYVIESSYIFDDEIVFMVIGNDLPISFFDIRNNNKTNLILPCNSFLKINGDLRYELIFGIPKKKKINIDNTIVNRKNSYLIIFRFLKSNNIEEILTHKNKKKGQDKKNENSCIPINIKELDIEKLENIHVVNVYNKIAQHFDHTRQKTWKNVENLIKEENKGNLIIDIGCGSGKYLNVSNKYFYIGLDISFHLLKIAQKKDNTELLLANCVNIPLKSNLADLCISIAVIHHIGNFENRKKAIEEMVRCTKINGRILIYVWAYEQNDQFTGNRQFNSQDILVPWFLQKQHATDFDELHNDIFKNGLLKLERYYHVFKKEEIYDLCNSVSGIKIEKIYFDCNNWAIIMRKIF